MSAIVPGSGEFTSGTSISGNEYSFYNDFRNNKRSYINSTPEERTLYDLLASRVATYGLDSLSKTSMSPPGVVGGGNKPILNYGSSSNPAIFNTLQEAQQSKNFHSLHQVKPGLYQEQSLENGYVFILSNPSGQRQKTATFNPSASTSYIPMTAELKPKISPWGSPKHVKKEKPVMKKVAQDYDLLFNALEYLTTYESEIKKLTMELVNSGDDILTNYNYESIDFLPDVDIEVKTVNGEYVNSSNVFSQTERSEYINSIVDDSESSEEIELVNELISYIEDKIGVGASYNQIINYFGSYNSADNKFTKSMPRGTVLDFFMQIPEKFQDLDIEIRFDVI